MPSEMADDPFFAEAIAERKAEEAAARKRAAKGERVLKEPGVKTKAEAKAGGAAVPEKSRKKGKNKKRARELSEEERAEEMKRSADLELLLMDGDDVSTRAVGPLRRRYAGR